MSDPVKVHSDLKNILSRSEFQIGSGASNNPLTQAVKFVQHKWETFTKWFNKLFKFASEFGTLGQAVVYGIIAILLVGAAWVLAKVLREYFQNRVLSSVADRTVFDEDDPEDSISHDAAVWLQDGANSATVSDYRRAYRAVFVATLMQCEAAEIFIFQRGRTNGEYYRSVRDNAPKAAAETFLAFVIGFDTRWYGSQSTSEADYQQALTFYAEIRHALVQAAPTVGTKPLAAEGA